MGNSHFSRYPDHPASRFCRNIPAIIGWYRFAIPSKRRSQYQVGAMVDVALKMEISSVSLRYAEGVTRIKRVSWRAIQGACHVEALPKEVQISEFEIHAKLL